MSDNNPSTSVVAGLLIIAICFGILFFLGNGSTSIVRMEDGHQYIKATSLDGDVDIEHLEGCDHPSHNK